MIKHVDGEFNSSLNLGTSLRSYVLTNGVTHALNDPFIGYFANCLCRSGEPIDTRQSLSISDFNPKSSDLIRGLPVEHVPFQQYRDFSKYSDPFSAFAVMVSGNGLDSRPDPNTPFGETQCTHVSSRGLVQRLHPMSDLQISVAQPQSFGVFAPRRVTSYRPWFRNIAISGSGHTLAFSPVWTGYPSGVSITYILEHLLEDLQAFGGEIVLKTKLLFPNSAWWVTGRASEFKFQTDERGMVRAIQYKIVADFGVTSTGLDTRLTGETNITLDPQFRVYRGALVPTGTRPLTANLDVSVKYVSAYATAESMSSTPPSQPMPSIAAVLHSQTINTLSTVTRGPSLETANPSSELYKLIREPRYEHLGGYKSRHHAIAADLHRLYLGSIRPTATLSTHDAIKKETEIIKANHLETLKEFGEVISLIPDVLSLIADFYATSRLNVGGNKISRVINMVGSILDLLSNATLLFSYGAAPTFQAALEFSEMIGPLISKIRAGLAGPRTLYGKFSWTFPDDPMGYPMRLVTRSKVRVRFDEETALFSALSTARYLGLLPTTGNLWDLIPWSFAIDSVTGVGNRLDVLDAHAQLLGIRFLYGLHSFTFSGDYPSDVLTRFGLNAPSWASGKSLPGFQYYVREFSLCVPSPRLSSRGYDFTPPHFMSWGNIGSLVYTRL